MIKLKSFFKLYRSGRWKRPDRAAFIIITLTLLTLLLTPTLTTAQTTCRTRISLLTCTPGEELYSTFGHSALRVTDSVSNTDIVYNYGTFNFEEPGFYTKFIRGKLLYYLSIAHTAAFIEDYRYEQRGITEQVLTLTCIQKQKILDLLAHNMLPENRGYKYDFLFDNCTTRLRDLVEKVSGEKVTYPSLLTEKTPFRKLIHNYLDLGGQHWSKLGIDLLLGSRTDRIMNDREVMFLPDYLMYSFDGTTLGATKLVVEKTVALQGKPAEADGMLTSPLIIFSLLFIAVFALGFSKNQRIQTILNRFDSFLFFITGFAGIVILIMWFGTDHIMCRDNYNIIWAWPTHAIAAFYIHGNRWWAKKYFIITAIAYIIILLAWFFIPQKLNPAFIPMILLLAWRSYKYVTHQNRHGK